MITIRLNLTLINQSGDDEVKIELENSMTFDQLIKRIGIEKDSVGMVIKNGRWAQLDCSVEENDSFELFPHLEGG